MTTTKSAAVGCGCRYCFVRQAILEDQTLADSNCFPLGSPVTIAITVVA